MSKEQVEAGEREQIRRGAEAPAPPRRQPHPLFIDNAYEHLLGRDSLTHSPPMMLMMPFSCGC